MVKKIEKKIEEAMFTKEQILASNKYLHKRDVISALLPNDFNGSLKEVDILIEKFMKGKVN